MFSPHHKQSSSNQIIADGCWIDPFITNNAPPLIPSQDMNSSSSSNSNASQQLELWVRQQREYQQAGTAADSEREKLMVRFTEIKSNTAKIRHATLQAKDTLGKHHTICLQLEAKKKQLERQLRDERVQSETCAAKLATLNTTVLAFQKQAADQYHTLNKEIAQVNQEFIDDMTKSYITVDSVHLLENVVLAAGAGTAAASRVDTAALYADMKRDLAELGQLENTRDALVTRVKFCRGRTLVSASATKNPVRRDFYSRTYCLLTHDKLYSVLFLPYSRQSITEASLLELERNWSNHDVEPNNENAAGTNDTVQLQLFYGQE
jgi:hypothetical protein